MNARHLLEIIRKFGVEKPGRPATGDDEPYVIQISFPEHGRTNCYGKTVEDAAIRAYHWLRAKGWKPEGELATLRTDKEQFERGTQRAVEYREMVVPAAFSRALEEEIAVRDEFLNSAIKWLRWIEERAADRLSGEYTPSPLIRQIHALLTDENSK